VAGILATFLVAGAAYAFYASVINDASTTVKSPQAFGPNNNAPTTFAIDQNAGVVPKNLQPAGAGCVGTSGAGTLASPGNNCAPWNTTLDASGTSTNGNLLSVTLTGISFPNNPGCPAGSAVVVWPDGSTASVDGSGHVTGSATYTWPTPIPFTAGATGVEMFPTESGDKTQSGQPYLEALDTGTNQNACANDGSNDGTGEVDITISAHAQSS
jgi:hypothetical protein